MIIFLESPGLTASITRYRRFNLSQKTIRHKSSQFGVRRSISMKFVKIIREERSCYSERREAIVSRTP